MQLKLTTEINTVTLPLNYQHIQQSIIYHHLAGDPVYRGFVHDRGWENNNRAFRLFQFSHLDGPFSVRNKMITFHEHISWEIRSIDNNLINVLYNSIKKDGITYLEQKADSVEVDLSDYEVEADSILVRMLTPICVYSTDPYTRKTYFYSPKDAEFGQKVAENFARKYCAYSNIPIDDGIYIEPVNVMPRDKFVTQYKGIYFTGWGGEYRIRGNRKYLNFLYQVGLGSRNSQGFGMFEII